MPSEKRARQRALRDQKYAVEERKRRRSRLLRRAASLTAVAGVVIALIVLLSQHSPPKKAATNTSTTTTTVAPTTTTAPTATTTALSAAIAPTCPPAGGSAKRETAFTKAPGICISPTATYLATVKTDVGSFVITMPATKSLLAVNNFVFLSEYHFYDSIKFHRVIPGFMAQGGDPLGTGAGGPGYSFTGNTPAAGCTTCYAIGAVAMANSGSPSSDGSQFFIVAGKEGQDLPPSYTDFGQVTSGMAVVQHIVADGNSSAAANGVPPKITHHIISITITRAA